MTAPAGFTLDPVSDGLHLPPSPPKQLKPQIYKDLSLFHEVDEHAINEARVNYPTFRELIWNLVYKKHFDDLQKARVIFRWMTCKELQNISFEDVKPGSEEQLLMAFKSGKTTYARIFESMARNAGLSCVTITGWAKGVDYRPGVAITSRPVNHSWNSVFIDSNWQLIDSHWATRFLQSDNDLNPDNLVYEYDDFYFITEPEQLAYTHRPEDSVWQLLDTRQTADQFEEYPLVKSYFFTNGMFFPQHQKHGVIHAKKGIAALSLSFSKKTSFTFKLVYSDNMMEIINGVELNRYVVQETNDSDVTYYIRVPCRGDFYLIVFAHLFIDPVKAPENVFKAVAEYKIVAGNDVPKDVSPFPGCSDLSWGPDAILSQYGLTPHTKEAILKAPKGHAEVAFDKGHPDVRLYARLVKDGVPDADLKHAVNVKNENDKVTVDINLPNKGEYGLEIFANDPTTGGDMFTHVSQYLCTYTDANLDDIYGKPSHFVPVKKPTKRIGSSGEQTPEITDEYYKTLDAEMNTTAPPIVPQHSVEPEDEYKPQDEIYTAPIADIQPPEHFVVKPKVDSDTDIKPEVVATHKPFIDPAVFQHIDTHALEVSKLEHVTFRDILWHLIYARSIKNELDIARALFLWLCSKDLSKMNFPNVEPGSPEEILMNLQRGQTTYARVYETLCSYAGLHCKTLTGYAKGADYKPGMQFATHPSQHSWNAVLVNGVWQLVDCHWAARRLVGQKAQQAIPDNVRYELDEYYFMPAPSQLIYTHFPDEENWQLLERPLTLPEFEDLVPVKPAFFKHGLSLVSHTNAVIHCNSNVKDVSIRIKCPRQKAKSLRFTFNLMKEDNTDSFQGAKLSRFAMQELVGNICYLTVRPPQKASYLLVVYAKDLNDKSKEGVYGGICEYKIVNEEDRADSRPFPPCVHTTWGPGDSASKFDMIPLQSGSVIHTADGVAEVRFRLVSKLRFVAKLKSNEADDKALAQYVLYRVADDVAIFRVHAPAVGDYGLEIYANNPETGGAALQHAYQYLIICKSLPESGPAGLFPVLAPGALGPQVAFAQCGLSTVSHADPYIVTETGDLQVTFRLTQPLRMTSQLSLASESPAKDCSEYILQQGSGGSDAVTFILQPPQTGMYKFQLFGVPQTETSENLPSVYTYLINCHQTAPQQLPFPKQFGSWKDGCYLYEPMEGHLQANRPSKGSASSVQHVYFKMDVPRAHNVAVVVGTEWTQLQQKQPGMWQGEVNMEKHWKENEHKATVCANYGATTTSYSTLLEFSI